MRKTLIESITGVVLAGGRSSRMGTDKARLRVNDETLLESVVAKLHRCFPHVLVITKDDEPGLGPLGGLATAMRRVPTAGVFVVACDMPFLNVELVRWMAGRLEGWEAVAVRGEPLHATYACSVLNAIERQIAANKLSLHALLDELRVNYLTDAQLAEHPEWRRSFFNANTPAEFEQAQAMAKGAGHGQ